MHLLSITKSTVVHRLRIGSWSKTVYSLGLNVCCLALLAFGVTQSLYGQSLLPPPDSQDAGVLFQLQPGTASPGPAQEGMPIRLGTTGIESTPSENITPGESSSLYEGTDIESDQGVVEAGFYECTGGGGNGVCPQCGRIHGTAAKTQYPTIKVTGLGQLDTVWFGQDSVNRAVVGDLQDGSDIRRARLGAGGLLAPNVGYFAEMDFAFNQRINVTDVYLDINDVPLFQTVRIGRWRLPFNMDALTSVKELTFLERSLPFVFAPFRQIGTGFQGTTENERTTWAASVFRFPTDEFGGNVGDNGGYSTVGRLTHAIPLGPQEDGGALHFGADYSFIDPANDSVRYATPPEIGVGETGGGVPPGVPSTVPPFVDTGILAVNNVNLFDVELAMTNGPAHVQSELVYAVVDQIGSGTVAFPGVYTQVGYILTGETRPYNWKNAVLGRVVPRDDFGNGGIGAWELAFRWSMVDLSDADVDGGKLTDLTAGLNWYLNAHAKIQLNYIHAFLDRPMSVKSDADIAAARAQLDF